MTTYEILKQLYYGDKEKMITEYNRLLALYENSAGKGLLTVNQRIENLKTHLKNLETL